MKRRVLLCILPCLLLSCSQSHQHEQSTWQTEYEMIAPDSSFSAKIDYLLQSDDYENVVFRLGITPIKSIAEDTRFHTNSIGKTKYYYGSVTIQGSMHNFFHAFASADFEGGVLTFDSDYILTFPNDYEPYSLAGRSIEMLLIK